MKKLALTKVDTSLFQSSKSLGRARETRQDVLDRHQKEIEAGLRTSAPDGADLDESGSSSSDASSDIEEEQQEDSRQVFQGLANDGSVRSKAPAVVPALGSGLKRPLELDQEGKPVIIKRRKRYKKTIPTPELIKASLEQTSSEEAGSDAGSDIGSGKNENGSTGSSLRDDESTGQKGFLADDDGDAAASEGSTDTSEDELPEGKKTRITAFKAWADQQRNQAHGFVPSVPMEQLADSGPNQIQNAPRPRRERDEDPLPAELQSKGVYRKAFAVEVERNQDIQKHRLALPVTMEEHKIMEAIHNNPAVLICGTTGSGKTTQIPQFLFESGYGDISGPNPGVIGITQPRRVAAVSMARRVAAELCQEADRVAYKVCSSRGVIFPLSKLLLDSVRRVGQREDGHQVHDRRNSLTRSSRRYCVAELLCDRGRRGSRNEQGHFDLDWYDEQNRQTSRHAIERGLQHQAFEAYCNVCDPWGGRYHREQDSFPHSPTDHRCRRQTIPCHYSLGPENELRLRRGSIPED